MKLHKLGKETAEFYCGFGRYESVTAPLCVGAKGLWAGKSYQVVYKWANVTCKNCLKIKERG